MENNKEKKISFRLVLCLLIIVLLISIIAGMWFYYNYIQKSKNTDYNQNDLLNRNVNISGTTTETTTNPSKQNESIIMYSGMNIANAKPGIYTFDNEYKKYENCYNTTYDIYENGKNQGKTKGNVVENTDIEGNKCYIIEYDKKDFEEAKNCIFVSCNYNVVPRNYVDETNIPNIIQNEFSDCDSIKMQSIDLDGDNIKEYLVSYLKSKDELSGICLFDANFNKISNLADQYSSYLSNFDGVTYMDIDNDGNMEIIIDIPVAASYFRFGIYEYSNKTVKGEIDTFGIGG